MKAQTRNTILIILNILLNKVLNYFLNYCCVVLLRILRSKEEGDGPLFRLSAELFQYCAVGLQLLPVAFPEFLPPGGIMAEPGPELIARRDLLQPFVDPGPVPGNTPGPEPIHQDPPAVASRRRVIDPLDHEHVRFPI